MKNEEKMDLLQSYTADQLAVIRHIIMAVDRQVQTDKVRNNSEVSELLTRVKFALDKQRDDLTLHLEREMGGKGVEGAAKNALTSATGFFAGLYSSVRNDTISRMIRDDCAALNFACLCYSMLYATATAFEVQKTATVATTHLHELTPLVVELNKALPGVVVDELSEDGYDVRRLAIRAAIDEIGNAWSHHHTGEGRI